MKKQGKRKRSTKMIRKVMRVPEIHRIPNRITIQINGNK